MKKILILLAICFTMLQAYQYDIYDINGKNRGTFTGIPNKHTLAKFITENHGSLLVKRSHPNSGNFIKSINASQISSLVEKQIDLTIDSLHDENWLEVEKNEIVKICIDDPVVAWETSLNSSILNDSCLAFQAPILIGSENIKVYFSKKNRSYKINLAVGMKFLNFKNEIVLLGFNTYDEFMQNACDECQNTDPERLVSVTGTYLVDKYPVTKCEFLQLMWDSIPEKNTYNISSQKMALENWNSRKKSSIRNENCIVHDSATNTESLYLAMKYANARSMQNGLKPYYIFTTPTNRLEDKEGYLRNGYVIGYWDFIKHENKYINVIEDSTSDGYRLPYYDEWMMFARGGDKKNKAPWKDNEPVSKYAKYIKHNYESEEAMYYTEPVGMLQPNGYGLYDIFGIVAEHVMSPPIGFIGNFNFPSCQKGGNDSFDYGQYEVGYSGIKAGFRLVRNIGNNVKWNKIESGTK